LAAVRIVRVGVTARVCHGVNVGRVIILQSETASLERCPIKELDMCSR
jgi:hypothetical protein